MLATYTGSKAFLEKWSQALGEEVASRGVDVRLVVPYFVVRLFSCLVPSLSSDMARVFLHDSASLIPLLSSRFVPVLSWL